MNVKAVEPARAEELKQAQRGSERGVVGGHHGLPHQVQAVISCDGNAAGVDRGDSTRRGDGPTIPDVRQHFVGNPLSPQLLLVDVRKTKIKAPLFSHGAHVEGAPLALAGADELLDGKQVLP